MGFDLDALDPPRSTRSDVVLFVFITCCTIIYFGIGKFGTEEVIWGVDLDVLDLPRSTYSDVPI